MDWLKKICTPSPWKRALFFLVFDTGIIIFSFYVSFLLRFGFVFPPDLKLHFTFWLGILIILDIIILAIQKLYTASWRFYGLHELFKLFGSAVFSLILLLVFNFFLRSQRLEHSIPYGVILMTTLLSFSLIMVLRFSKRIFSDLLKNRRPGLRTMIIGANFSTERLLKELFSEKENRFWPVVIIDDDPVRIGTSIAGIKVTKGMDRLVDAIHQYQIEALLITLPKSKRRIIPTLFEDAKKAGIKHIKVIPKIDDCNSGAFSVRDFRNIEIEDLLCRPEVKIDFEGLKNFFHAKTVMITGAAGTIGSEIVRKLVFFGVEKVIAFEIDETEIFNLQHELRQNFAGKADCVHAVVGDIRDESKLKQIIEIHKPDMIFHAAACKHVPLMEDFPEEAVKTNIFGTFNLAKLASDNGVEKFINISTDKAVNPMCIMGASKRASEILCRSFNSDKTRFVSVRFGNVLGSRGSVVPVFLSQIKNGGPLTVTHPEMKRYFMATSEAVLLVFQAASMGAGGEVFVLDMGQPIGILDMAEKLIRLNGLEPYRDMDIVFSGLRPGEKLFEELLTAEEGTDPTINSQIFCARNGTIRNKKEIRLFLNRLANGIDDKGKIEKEFRDFLPFYKGHQNFQ
jgi:FlaA1/EpsC-like NDP-sugar epimerase